VGSLRPRARLSCSTSGGSAGKNEGRRDRFASLHREGDPATLAGPADESSDGVRRFVPGAILLLGAQRRLGGRLALSLSAWILMAVGIVLGGDMAFQTFAAQ